MTGLQKKKIVSIFVAFVMFFSVSLSTHAERVEYVSEKEIVKISYEIGNRYCICPELLQAIAFRESSYQSKATNGTCIGLMQVSRKWHIGRMEKLGVKDLYDPYGNMLVAADYLSELFNEYEDVGVVLMKYNGDSNWDDFMNGEAELSKYANDILMMSEELEREHGK